MNKKNILIMIMVLNVSIIIALIICIIIRGRAQFKLSSEIFGMNLYDFWIRLSGFMPYLLSYFFLVGLGCSILFKKLGINYFIISISVIGILITLFSRNYFLPW
jgi:hypothetical protein